MSALGLSVPAELLDAIACRVVDELERRGHATNGATSSPWMTLDEAATYLRCGKQRLYDLAVSGDLAPSSGPSVPLRGRSTARMESGDR